MRNIEARLVFGEPIAKSKKLASLSMDAEILFLRALVNLDAGNKIVGDGALLLAIIHPRNALHFGDRIEELIQEWVNAGLAEIVPAADKGSDEYIHFIEPFSCEYVDPYAER